MKYFLLILSISVLMTGIAYSQITSAATGNWGDGATWTGGVVPGAADNVSIQSGHTVTINVTNAACNDLNVTGNLYFALTTGLGIVVNGNVTVNATGKIQAASANPASGAFYQTIELKKDLSVTTGGRFDMRQSSGANLAVGRVVFSGTSNSTISLSLSTYTSTTEEFNSVVINKSGGAKVILAAGNLFQNNNSTNAGDTLLLVSGIIETGNNTWVHLATGESSVQGASSSSYVNGKLGRGISNGGGNNNRSFPIGDAVKYRPISVRTAAPANATGHYVWASIKNGNANTGTSTFTGNIDKVSTLRYYEVGYLQNAGSAASMPLYGFTPNYNSDDGVIAGNMDLRVSASVNNRAAWDGYGPTTDTTNLTTLPKSIASDSIVTQISVATGTSIFVSLARSAGTVTNPLDTAKIKAPVYSISKKTFSFGTIKINQTKKDSTVVSNTGDDTLKISSIISSSTDFTVTPSVLNIAPSGSSKIYLTFAPATAGGKNGNIYLTHNAATSPDTIKLSGTGQNKAAIFSADKKNLVFGSIKINLTKKDSVVVSNTGDDTLKIATLVSSSSDFTVSLVTLTLAPSDTAKVYVTFAPTTVGAKTGRIIATHNASTSPDTLTLSGTGDPSTSVRPDDYVPTDFVVYQNYPNPFNPETSISYEIPERTFVKIEVFTLLGSSVGLLQNDVMNIGVHTVRWNSSGQPSGIYFYRITTRSKTFTKRMMLIK